MLAEFDPRALVIPLIVIFVFLTCTILSKDPENTKKKLNSQKDNYPKTISDKERLDNSIRISEYERTKMSDRRHNKKETKGNHLARNIFIVTGIVFCASLFGGLSGGGVSVEFVIVKALGFGIAGTIIYGIVKGIKTLM